MLRSLNVLPRLAVRSFTSTTAVKNTEAPSRKDVEELFSDNSQERKRNAYSKNHVEIVGGVANDPFHKLTKNDRALAVLNVITNHRFKLANGEFSEQNERHAITFFGKQADYVAKNIKRGNRVMIEGRLHHSGGQLSESGERTPKQTFIHGETIQVIAARPSN